MKSTAVIALVAITLTVAGCTTSDPTPPGSLGGLSEAEEGDEAEGIPDEEELAEGGAGEGAAGNASEEEGAGEDTADQTEAQPKGEGETEDEGEGAAQGDGEAPSSSGGLPDPAQMTDEVCVAFFDGSAPLAARVQDSRFMVKRGSVNNLTATEYQEIDVLAQRLDALGATAKKEQAKLIEMVNAPFVGVQRAVTDSDGQNPESGEVTYDSIDTEESAQAQDEFTQACRSDAADSP